jgi:hypothetical protein
LAYFFFCFCFSLRPALLVAKNGARGGAANWLDCGNLDASGATTTDWVFYD